MTAEPTNGQRFADLMGPLFEAMSSNTSLSLTAPADGEKTAEDLMQAIAADNTERITE